MSELGILKSKAKGASVVSKMQYIQALEDKVATQAAGIRRLERELQEYMERAGDLDERCMKKAAEIERYRQMMEYIRDKYPPDSIAYQSADAALEGAER